MSACSLDFKPVAKVVKGLLRQEEFLTLDARLWRLGHSSSRAWRGRGAKDFAQKKTAPKGGLGFPEDRRSG